MLIFSKKILHKSILAIIILRYTSEIKSLYDLVGLVASIILGLLIHIKTCERNCTLYHLFLLTFVFFYQTYDTVQFFFLENDGRHKPNLWYIPPLDICKLCQIWVPGQKKSKRDTDRSNLCPRTKDQTCWQGRSKEHRPHI